MSDANFREEPRRVINGPRPSPLRIKKDSHVIQKPSVNISADPTNGMLKQQDVELNQNRRRPVIIYAHSPEIIHTKPRDFMALVQKLTGLSESEDRIAGAELKKNKKKKKKNQRTSFAESNSGPVKANTPEENDSSSVTTDEQCRGNKNNTKKSSSAASPINKGPNPHLAEIPLFTPNSNNLFYSPPPLFGHPDVGFPCSVSPTFLEFMKQLPEC